MGYTAAEMHEPDTFYVRTDKLFAQRIAILTSVYPLLGETLSHTPEE
jgi:hypothetical protein